jgi:hypothetical protein
MGDVDIVALENTIRTPFRTGGTKILGEDGKVCCSAAVHSCCWQHFWH